MAGNNREGYHREYYLRNIEKKRLYNQKNKHKHRLYIRAKDLEVKMEMVAAYGGCCSCCGEFDLRFLTLEHVNGDGKRHRSECGNGAGTWRDLKRRGWPRDGYTVLCMNCNFATRFGEVCPHKIQNQIKVSGDR